MRALMLLVAGGGLAASAVVHLLTFVPGSSLAMGKVAFLHVLVFIPFIAMVVQARRHQATGRMPRGVLGQVPAPVRAAAGAVFVYAILNFGLFIREMSRGSPMARDGRYYRADHGRIVGEIPEAEYRRLQAIEVRGFSGHWLVFYGAPAIFFGFVEGKAKRRADPPHPAAAR